jgi:peptidoglycan lytic transglycosylase
MLVRLSAAICGVAMIFACSPGATAKSPAIPVKPGPAKTANRKIAHSAAPAAANRKPALDANGSVSSGRVFAAGVAPFLCAERPVTFADRFRPALMVIARSKLAQSNADELGIAIIGAASMYNPYRPGYQQGGIETASGELYDPAAWTAAIQTDLREDFGGVRYGKDYRPAYALIESTGKRVIVKINDVGPLKPGRIIDLNQQVMYYFDPSLRRGLVADITITPLPGDDWVAGPVERRPLMSVVAQALY